jgi:hypothetical protein
LVAEAEEAAAVEAVRVAVVEEEAAAAAAEARLVAEAAETARLRLAAVEATRIAAEQAASRLAAEDAQFDAGDALPPGGCQQVSEAGAAVGLQEALLAKVPTIGDNTCDIWRQESGAWVATHRATSKRIGRFSTREKAVAAWHTYGSGSGSGSEEDEGDADAAGNFAGGPWNKRLRSRSRPSQQDCELLEKNHKRARTSGGDNDTKAKRRINIRGTVASDDVDLRVTSRVSYTNFGQKIVDDPDNLQRGRYYHDVALHHLLSAGAATPFSAPLVAEDGLCDTPPREHSVGRSVIAQAQIFFPRVEKAKGTNFSNFVRRLSENKKAKKTCYVLDESTGQPGKENSHSISFAPGYKPLLFTS